MAEKSILATVTGEYFQPVRLHYRVSDQHGLLAAFKKLRCVDHDPSGGRWVWLYDFEARHLQFQRSYAEIPKDLRPIVIGSFFLRSAGELHLDLRSPERAVSAIPFFDRHVPRRAAKVTEAEVVNRLFSAEDQRLTPASLFDSQESVARDPEAAVRSLVERAADIPDPQERLRIAAEQAESLAKRPLPEIERFPVHYYEDGIHGFSMALKLRQIVALQHWLGNPGYTLSDALQALLKPG